MPGTDVLIMAAGGGARFGGQPKQLVELRSRPVIVWAIEQFSRRRDIETVTVVATPGQENRFQQIIDEHGLEKVRAIVPGGGTRQESVWLGLQSLGSQGGKVLVHDAARPCVSAELIERVLRALEEGDAVVPALPLVDTLIREDGRKLDALLDRVNISGVQTPQGFRTELLVRAHRNALAKGLVSSDDGSLVFALGESVRTVPGERTNLKITFEVDVPIAEAILGLSRNRT